MTPLIIDPELAGLFCPQLPEVLAGLEANIRAEGCREAITVWKGHNIILDGHTRHAICQKLGKGFKVDYVELPDRDHAKLWIYDHQENRRNHTAGQRAEAAIKREQIAGEIAGRAKANQQVGPKGLMNSSNPCPTHTRKKMAEKAGVSEDTIRKTAKVLAEGDAATKAALHAGTMSVNAAYEETFPEPPPAPKPKNEKLPDDAPKDERGNVLPAKLLPAFAVGDEIAAVMGKLSALKGQVLKSAAEGDKTLWEHFNVGQFSADLDNARNLLKRVKPYAICPYCQAGERGSGKHCGKDGCEGKGWVDFFRWQTTPKEMRT